MALSFCMDVHVPAAITDSLRRRDLDILTSQEDNTRTAADPELLKRSTELQRVLVSQDTDFFPITSEWLAAGREFYGLVFVPQLSSSIGKIVEDLELIAHCYLEEENRDTVIFFRCDRDWKTHPEACTPTFPRLKPERRNPDLRVLRWSPRFSVFREREL